VERIALRYGRSRCRFACETRIEKGIGWKEKEIDKHNRQGLVGS
jgi:hypothetical protein